MGRVNNNKVDEKEKNESVLDEGVSVPESTRRRRV